MDKMPCSVEIYVLNRVQSVTNMRWRALTLVGKSLLQCFIQWELDYCCFACLEGYASSWCLSNLLCFRHSIAFTSFSKIFCRWKKRSFFIWVLFAVRDCSKFKGKLFKRVSHLQSVSERQLYVYVLLLLLLLKSFSSRLCAFIFW